MRAQSLRTSAISFRAISAEHVNQKSSHSWQVAEVDFQTANYLYSKGDFTRAATCFDKAQCAFNDIYLAEESANSPARGDAAMHSEKLKSFIGTSIPATEHSVMCTYGDDRESFKRLITEIYPSGFISIVSDTWDLWEVLTEILPSFKNEVMARDGKVVIRPDSGDPVKIMCGDPEAADVAARKRGCGIVVGYF